jgi:hypothetical protein
MGAVQKSIVGESLIATLNESELSVYARLGGSSSGKLTPAEHVRFNELHDRMVHLSREDSHRLFVEDLAERSVEKLNVRNRVVFIEMYVANDPRLQGSTTIYSRREYRARLHELASTASAKVA